MIVKHGDHNDFAEALSGHYISHTNTSLDFTAGPVVTTSVVGLDFTDVNAWHCIVVSLSSSGITYLVDESKSGTGMLSESQATNVSAADVEFGSTETDIGLVIRMPNALTLDQMYTLKRSTQEPFLGSRFSVCPFSFSAGNLVVNYSSPAAVANLPWRYTNINGWVQVKNLPPNAAAALTSSWSWYSGNDWGHNNTFGDNSVGTVLYTPEWQRSIADTLTAGSLSDYTQICFQSLDGTSSTQPHKWLILSKDSFVSLIQNGSQNAQSIPTTVAHSPAEGTPTFQNLTSNGGLDPMVWIQTSSPTAYYHLYAEDSWADYNSIANTGKTSQMQGGMGVFIR
jgi:hypothetical protein